MCGQGDQGLPGVPAQKPENDTAPKVSHIPKHESRIGNAIEPIVFHLCLAKETASMSLLQEIALVPQQATK